MKRRAEAEAESAEAKRRQNAAAVNRYRATPKGDAKRVREQAFAGAEKYLTQLTQLGEIQDASPSTGAKDAKRRRVLRDTLSKLIGVMPDVEPTQFAIDNVSPQQMQLEPDARISNVEPLEPGAVEPPESASAQPDLCMKKPGACDRMDGHDGRCNTRLVVHEDITLLRAWGEIGAQALDPIFDAIYQRLQHFSFEHKLLVFELAEQGFIKVPEAYHTHYPTNDVSGAGETKTPWLRRLNSKIMNRKTNWKQNLLAKRPQVVQYISNNGGTNQISGVNNGEMNLVHVEFRCGKADFVAAAKNFKSGGMNSHGP